MLKPLFAVGRNLERSLAQSEPVGATALHIASPLDFTVGDPIFVADADGDDPEYLGRVETIESDSIVVSRALEAARDDTALVWTPSSYLQWRDVAADPRDSTWHGGVAVERATGGGFWSVRTAQGWNEEMLRFNGLAGSGFDAYRAWLDAAVGGGTEEFTRVDASGALARVRLLDCDLHREETRPRTVDLVLRLAVIEEGGYI